MVGLYHPSHEEFVGVVRLNVCAISLLRVADLSSPAVGADTSRIEMVLSIGTPLVRAFTWAIAALLASHSLRL